MYLIKRIHSSGRRQDIRVENGIKVNQTGRKLVATNEFWGKTDIHLGDYADFSKFGKTHSGEFMLLSYVSCFTTQSIGDGFQKLDLHVNAYKQQEIRGYLVFMNRTLEEIKTSGQKIFGRRQNEIVALLKDGDYLEFDGRRIEVIDKRLVLLI